MTNAELHFIANNADILAKTLTLTAPSRVEEARKVVAAVFRIVEELG